jgi:hypothetical protein
MPRTKLEDIGDIISEAGFDRIKKGQTLTFNYEGTLTDYKIMKKYQDDKGLHVLVKKITLYTPDQVDIVDKNGNN